VTHDQEEAMTLSDQIAVMREGRIIQIGTPGEVYERPRTKFVSTFLGDSNFFQGLVVDHSGDNIKVDLGSGRVLEALADGEVESGQKTTLAIRPEKISLSAQKPERANTLAAKVLHRVYMGTATNYILMPEVGERISVFSQNQGHEPAFFGE
jgi:ABC-type Fe3+/spermidine/putrescine transport system ATPase subunit